MNSTPTNDSQNSLPFIPSKSRCLKWLREVFGPNARFQTLDDGALEVWNKTEAGDHPLGSAKGGDPAVRPWVAARAAFRALGYSAELHTNPKRVEFAPLCPHGKAGACLECLPQA